MATTYPHILWYQNEVLELVGIALLVDLWVVVTEGGWEGSDQGERGRGRACEGWGQGRKKGGAECVRDGVRGGKGGRA